MTEMDFWMFLKSAWAVKGRIDMVSGYVESSDREIQNAGNYLSSHSVLFEGHDSLPIQLITDMGRLLLSRSATIEAKRAILMILAHHPTVEALGFLTSYSKNPDRELRYFANMAFEECVMWNE